MEIRISGIFGAIVATLEGILSGFIISIFHYNFFKKHKNIDSIANVLKGLRSSSVGLIASAAITIIMIAFLGSQSFDYKTANINIHI